MYYKRERLPWNFRPQGRLPACYWICHQSGATGAYPYGFSSRSQAQIFGTKGTFG